MMQKLFELKEKLHIYVRKATIPSESWVTKWESINAGLLTNVVHLKNVVNLQKLYLVHETFLTAQ